MTPYLLQTSSQFPKFNKVNVDLALNIKVPKTDKKPSGSWLNKIQILTMTSWCHHGRLQELEKFLKHNQLDVSGGSFSSYCGGGVSGSTLIPASGCELSTFFM